MTVPKFTIVYLMLLRSTLLTSESTQLLVMVATGLILTLTSLLSFPVLLNVYVYQLFVWLFISLSRTYIWQL